MAIAFDCPHCKHPYKLKDEFAGKQAKCKNPDCRRVMTVPAPLPVPDAAELEAAALSALADETPKAAADGAADGPANGKPAEKVIPMTCKFCDHHWTEPWSKAGKNALCQNPECRRPNRVPEPKEDVPTDWRQQKSKLPSMAKGNFEKLEGVQDAGEAQIVSGKALKDADATGEEFEPRPLKDYILFGTAVLALLGGLGYGTYYFVQRGKTQGEEELLAEARVELDKAAGELDKPTGEAGLHSALLHGAAAEYALRKNDPAKLKEAYEQFDKARKELQKVLPGPARNAVAAELALAALAFGGTDEQVKEQIRFRWVPDTDTRVLRANERTRTVHEELRQTLGLLQGADTDFKLGVARRLARELTKKGQAALAADLLPGLALFTADERDEARAVVALEVYRTDKGSDVPRRVAEELKTQFANPGKGAVFPPSAQTLFTALGIDKPQLFPPPPAGTGGIPDGARLAYAGTKLLEGNPDEAVALARRPGTVDGRLKALVLCAEWSDTPAAFDAAQQVVAEMRGKPSPAQMSLILRLSQLAAAAGQPDQAKALADAIPDDALKAWAKGDAARHRIAANPTTRAEESWAEVPDDVKKLRAGHAWGRLWVARQNAKLSGDRDAEKKAVTAWSPAPVNAFGLAGIALGLQDR